MQNLKLPNKDTSFRKVPEKDKSPRYLLQMIISLGTV